MFSSRKITTSTKEYSDNINRVKELLQNAEAVIIGAGAGLSTSAGFTYEKLFELIKDKDYFVLTTNVDHQFQKAGFDKHRLFYTQGDYGLFQCSEPCHNATYDNPDAYYVSINYGGASAPLTYFGQEYPAKTPSLS